MPIETSSREFGSFRTALLIYIASAVAAAITIAVFYPGWFSMARVLGLSTFLQLAKPWQLGVSTFVALGAVAYFVTRKVQRKLQRVEILALGFWLSAPFLGWFLFLSFMFLQASLGYTGSPGRGLVVVLVGTSAIFLISCLVALLFAMMVRYLAGRYSAVDSAKDEQ